MLALLPLALGLVPELAKWIAGDKAGTVAAQAADIVRTVTGTEDPAAAAAVLQDPAKAMELRIALANIALEQERARLADVANARQMGTQVSLIARAQVVGGAAILCVWAFMVLRMAVYGLPPGAAEFYATVLAGVSGVLGGILQFFYGNSTAANAANNRMDLLASQVTSTAQPAAIATTAPVVVAAPQPDPTATADELMDRFNPRPR
jgi:hypothetical protein